MIFINYYIIGIKGTGCSSLACYLKDKGHNVIGSDTQSKYFTDDILDNKNIQYFNYDINNIKDNYVYILGNGQDNIETREVIKRNYPYFYYSDFIDQINVQTKIAISGTHGKTTTTSLLSFMLNEINPSVIKGDGIGCGHDSEILIFEACEYKDNFLKYHPTISVINNIELDHPDYYKSKKQLFNSFNTFSKQSKYLVINGDNALCRKIKHPNKITFGFNKNNDFRCKIINKDINGYEVLINSKRTYLPFKGKHMIYNFLACYSIINSFYKDIDLSYNLNNYLLPKRRKEKWIFNNKIFISDYAHHPTEIKAFYDSLKQEYPEYKYIVFFEPHTYSRTIKFIREFKKALSKFDEVYINDVFISREKQDILLQKKIDKKLRKFKKLNKEKFNELVINDDQNKSIYIFLGAGSFNSYLKRVK